jgi:tetratricopeptide (TPR) repeat protein
VTVATLGVERDHLTLRCVDPALDESRDLDPDAKARFEGWADDYRRALRKETNAVELLAIGRALFTWLDSSAAWLTRLRRDAQPPLLLELAVPLRPSPLEHAFLEAPWELLADAAGHLAADPSLVLSPVRRLGATSKPEAPSDHRLSLVFMAAAPEGAASLDYESEERAILDATSGIGLDLVVEESGSLAALADMMAIEAPVDILHLSCHGLSDSGPRMLLEDELGKRAAATADDFAQGLGSSLPQRLLFLSACLSADRPRSSDLVGSFAATMIQRGCPATLGWGGSVKDSDATRFTAELLARLAHKEPLESAVARARHALLVPPDGAAAQTAASEWHLARLYVGAKGGGAFIKGNRARRRLTAEHGHSEFLDRKNSAVLVTSAREFVGRRRPLQRILSALRTPGRGRVVIHGVGGHGKSSLAARVAHRLVDHAAVVVVDRFDAVAILDAIDRALLLQEVSDIIKERRDIVRTDPANLVLVLRKILAGPCREIQRDARDRIVGRPLFLVLDNFEDILQPSTFGFHTVEPSLLEAMRAVVKAFDDADTTSGLLITSRYAFTLPDRDGRDLAQEIVHEPLGPMSPDEGEKQAVAKARARKESTPIARDRARRCIRAARGNPRLQNLLFLCAVATPTKCDAMLDQIDRHLADGSAPDDEALRDFLENLALDTLIALLSDGEKALLRASTLLSIPVPIDILAKLGEAAGASATEVSGARLIALGVWDQIVKPEGAEALVNALVRPKLAVLGEEERRAMAAVVVGPLFKRWGEDGSRRSFAMDIELTQLGIDGGDMRAVATAGADAVQALFNREELRKAASLGVFAIEALDREGQEVPLRLFRTTGEACRAISDVGAMRRCFDRALDLVTAHRRDGKTVDVEVQASIVLNHGRRLYGEGSPDAALCAYEEAMALLQDAGYRRQRAVVLSEIARFHADKGEVDAALNLQKEALEIYEELGARRERASMLGDIARLRAAKGEVDAALNLHKEALDIYVELRVRRERAITLGDIARLRADMGELDDALDLHKEALKVYEELGARHERAITLGDIARLHAHKDEVDVALKLHKEALKVYEELGARRERAIALGDIARLRADMGEVNNALELHKEALKVYEELENVDGVANAHWSMGRIALQQGDGDAAHKHLSTAYTINSKLGRLDAICIVGFDLAMLFLELGKKAEAIPILTRSRDGFLRLGRPDYAQRVQQIIDLAADDI